MTWENRGDRRGELRADPGIAPGSRNIDPPRRRRSIWPSIAVVAAFAAFGGVIWFAYQSGRGDGSGVPPLVRADPRPLKTKPDNPGGAEIPFQDSTVYDRLNQNGQKPVVEHLLPGPEAPVTRPPAGTPPADSAIDPPLVDTPPVIAHAPQAPVTQTPTLPPGAPGAPIADTGSPTVLAPSQGGIITQPPATAPHASQAAPAVKPVGADARTCRQAFGRASDEHCVPDRRRGQRRPVDAAGRGRRFLSSATQRRAQPGCSRAGMGKAAASLPRTRCPQKLLQQSGGRRQGDLLSGRGRTSRRGGRQIDLRPSARTGPRLHCRQALSP